MYEVYQKLTLFLSNDEETTRKFNALDWFRATCGHKILSKRLVHVVSSIHSRVEETVHQYEEEE